MKQAPNTASKTFTVLLLICSVTIIHRSQCMDPELNNRITVTNKYYDPNSLLQLSYIQTEALQYSKKANPVGFNTLINSPIILKCLIQKNSNDRSSLYVSDPRSQQKNGVKLKTSNGSHITINEKQNKAIVITDENERELGRLTYK